jgi:hypothetical protein
MSPEYIMSQKQGGLLDTPSAPQQERSFMDKLSSQEGLGSLGALMLSMSNNPNLQKLGMAELGDIQKRGMTNKTIKALRDAKREDLANAVESGMLGAADAAKILFAEKKKEAPIKLGAGETLLDPTTFKTIASGAPKESAFAEKLRWAQENPELAKKFNIFGGVTVDMGQNDAMAVVAKNFANMDFEALTGAQKSAKLIPQLQQTLDLIKNGKPATGLTANIQMGIDRVFSELGGAEAAARATDTQLLNALLGQDVFGQIQALGVGARGMDTPAEREFLREVMSGKISMEGEALERLTNIKLKYAKKAVEAYNEKVSGGYFDQYKGSPYGSRFSPIDVQEYTAPKAPPLAGQIIELSDGTKLKFIGGNPNDKANYVTVQ